MKPFVNKLKKLKKYEIMSLIGGSTFLVGLRVAGVATTYLTQVLLARWMGATELGHYVFAFSGCVVLFQFSTLGLPAAALRFIPQYEVAGDHGRALGFARRAQQIVFLSSLVVSAVAIGAVSLLDWESSSQTLTRVLAILCVPFFAMIVTDASVARSLSLLMLAVLPNLLLRQVLLLIGVVAFQVFFGNLSALTVAALMLLGMVILAVGQAALLYRHLKVRFANVVPSFDTKLWLRTGVPLLGAFAFTQFSQECNTFVAGVFLSPDQLAVFNAAYRTSSLVNYGMAAVNLMIAPTISRLFFSKDQAGLQRVIAQQALVRFLFAAGTVVILVLLGKYLLRLFGPEFVVGYRPLLILIAANLFAGAIGPVVQLLSIGGYEKRCAMVFACALAASAISNMILVSQLGLDGAAVSVFVVTVFWTTWLYLIVVRRLGIQPSILGFRRVRR